jgi:hypothetical protein
VRALVIFVVLVGLGSVAHAYPQFQISKDQTCTSCHISPAGGGLLTENGMLVAENISMFGTNPAFLNGAIDTPDWLTLGGDIRAMGGWLHAPQDYLLSFPMQGELYAAARRGQITAYVNVGMRPAQEGNESLTYFWSREHYVMWQTEEGASEGIFVRAGHFMPVFGLRWVEHPLYVRRYGGVRLFSETYGASAALVVPRLELHLSAFVENPLIDGARLSSGAAAYGELRLSDKTQIGGGAMYEYFGDQHFTMRGAITAKQMLTSDLLLQAELQVANPHVSGYGWRQLASYVMASYFGPKGLQLDIGWGHYDENLRIKDLDRDSIDLNVHWFATSHIELMLVNQIELIALGDGGPTRALSMFQVHYRL